MIVLDTSVLSEMMRPLASSAVESWISSHSRDELFTTAITVGEILYGIELLPKEKRREALFRQANETFTQDFAGHVLELDEFAARAFALISSARRTRGCPISTQDAQIAGIARAHGATLATRNVEEFQGCGVKLVNPWV